MLSCKRMQTANQLLLVLLLLCTGQRWAYAAVRWNTTPSHAHLTSNKCTITRLPRSELTTQFFRAHFLETAPVIVTGLGRYTAFRSCMFVTLQSESVALGFIVLLQQRQSLRTWLIDTGTKASLVLYLLTTYNSVCAAAMSI